MNIEIFSICDSSTTDGGKLNLLGAFDTIFVKNLPAAHPQCSISLRIRIERNDGPKHGIRIHILDPESKLVIPSLEGMVNVIVPHGQPSAAVNLSLNIQGLRLEKAGEYAIRLEVDGTERASVPLFVILRVLAS